ncbi:MAG: succinylglutamate desuccinylase/aspartoacylase family protein [Armatimonadetes bacterium]|nr:succinylglutamate desuccinylase/aspartoacylase family protein [Armatimonadota bacterium]
MGEDWRRRAEAVPYVVAQGRGAGPTIYLQAVSDGDELNGLAVIRRVVAELDCSQLRGALIAVLVANPGAFAANAPTDPRDGRKLNRCFPGLADGSVTERLAYLLFHELVLYADLVIDLHQNGTTPMIPEVRVRSGRRGPRHAESLELAMAFGLPHILDQQGPSGQLARAAPARGIPAIDPELGGNLGFDPVAIELGVRGVRNVMVHYGLLEGQPPPRQTPYIARRLAPLIADTGGIVDFQVALGDQVSAGQPIARCTDIFGHQASVITAPANGVLWIRRNQPVVTVGDTIGAIGVEEE